ncbi:uncharacterized protein YjiS (DUF1127 family) [Azospirillum brasilense]|uniref:DUF1127 domain-containing protein n=4 Tax=Azospirillum TaxID=191 RepID=A0A560CJK7_AZOBR|nr:MULTISPECIES: DUF1127 domain-containing protein [Azospirillum]MCR6630284.1 DUF1127 domain-containing protein [Magnetospirillum sp.]AIB12822.1 hypothetical protein ABAZ39_12650 [Azospirillum argentinense]AWJ85303.1 hypothetical protein TSH58p_09775 [Azospirillum sp. TSH58]AWJ90913.1 DUF1127 domain-containing protein [Azospirillum baldaniorum]EZQ09584.1 hypothetical protein ABAZ39_14055 [Azospirillum argentinense]
MAIALRTAPAGRTLRPAPVAYVLDSVLDTFALWRQRTITRRELARLDDRMLHDIGISQIDVEGEISKPFWKA